MKISEYKISEDVLIYKIKYVKTAFLCDFFSAYPYLNQKNFILFINFFIINEYKKKFYIKDEFSLTKHNLCFCCELRLTNYSSL